MAELTDYEVLHHITGVFISTGTAYFQEVHCYKFEVKPDPYFARFWYTNTYQGSSQKKRKKEGVCGFEIKAYLWFF